MPDILETLATTLAKQGAPVLGSIIGSAIGGPAGTAIGGLAGKALESLADAFGVDPTPEAVTAAVQAPGAVATLIPVEEKAKLMLPLWQIEAQRVSDAQAAEIKNGFGSWELWRGAWQATIVGGWIFILIIALIGGNLNAKPLLSVSEIVTAWGSVTLTWLAVFNGGHTLKEIAPVIGFGRKAA